MYFENCANAHLGATILLRGGTQTELSRVKRVTSTMIFAAYSWRLEKSFLMDEFATPPSQRDNTFLEDEMHDTDNKAKRTTTPESIQTGKKSYAVTPDVLSTDLGRATASISPNLFNDGQTVSFNETSILMNATTSQETSQVNSKAAISMETFKRVSTMLDDDLDPYDTLKLFKTRPKVALDVVERSELNTPNETIIESFVLEDTRNEESGLDKSRGDNSEEANRSKLREKIICEEKRVHGESVSDRSDPLHQYLKEENETSANVANDEISAMRARQRLNVADLPLLNKFKKALEDTTLSFSPYLKFSVPYLETELGRNCALRRFFPNDIFYSVYLLDKVERARASSVASTEIPHECVSDNSLLNMQLKPKHPFVLVKLRASIESRQVQALLANFRACGSRVYPTQNVVIEKVYDDEQQQPQQQRHKILDCLEPSNHQRLSVLFCSFSHSNRNNAPAFCVNPWVVNMDLYGGNDIPLGRFLERYCFTREYKCPAQGCRAHITQHTRRFAHDGGCVHISLAEYSIDRFGQGNTDQILMWTKCLKCQTISPVVRMSADTWSLSFAKYLELRFHGRVYVKRGTESICRHSLHQHHCQYFMRRNMLAVFKYTEISQWEISLPPPLIDINYDAKQHANVIEEIKSLALKGDEVFTNIREYFLNLQLEAEALSAAKQQLAKDQQSFKNKIEEIQLKLTSPTLENKKLEGKNSERHVQSLMFRIEDGIVVTKRLISEAVQTWNGRIQEMTAKKKDDRSRRFTEKSTATGTSSGGGGGGGAVDTDGYITEDTASESQVEDLSPLSADYNTVDAISAVNTELLQAAETIASSDHEINDITANPEDIVVIHGSSPKFHQRSHSDVLPITSDDVPDRIKKNKKKTILSQLLPSTTIAHFISNPLASIEHHLLPLG